jgi:plastocyanin
MRPLSVLAIPILGAALSAPAFGGELAPKRVTVGDNFFRQSSVSQVRNGRVTWVWRGRRKHDVFFYRAPDGARPKKCPLQRRGRCTRRFRTVGTYRYVCTRHGSMVGRVTVRR